MENQRCKNVTEDMFEKADYHHQLDDKPKTLPELETLTEQQLREKQQRAKAAPHPN